MPAEIGYARTLRVLRFTRNPAAVDLLFLAAESEEAAIRTGAAAVLSTRRDPGAQRRLVEKFSELAPDAQQVLSQVPVRSPLRLVLPKIFAEEEGTLCKRAALVAVTCHDFQSLGVMVELAARSEHPYAVVLATAALQLAKRLHAASEEFAAGKKTPFGDPAFVRRGAVQCLAQALEKFPRHRRLELVEAFLLLAPHDHETLLAAVRSENHPGHEALLTVLRSSPSEGAFGVLVALLHDRAAPLGVLQTLAERIDRPFLNYLCAHVTDPLPLRVSENCQRLKFFRWTSSGDSAVLLALDGPRQAAALRLGIAAGLEPKQLTRLCRALLADGQPEGRRAACKALEQLPDPLAIPLLKELLSDADAVVLATAAAQLRKHDYPDALPVLVELLSHSAEEVRSASQKSLYELRFAGFRAAYPQLSPRAREVAGALVAKADPHALEALQAELTAPGVNRRMRALEYAEVMGVERQLASALVERLQDHDAGVRAEAVRLLGGLEDASVLPAVATLTADPHATVRAAAEKSVAELKSLDVAAALVHQLALEFEP